MWSTTFFICFLPWFNFIADVHSEKVLFRSKGSSVVLSPDDAETNITRIRWRHGGRFVAVGAGGNPTFFFKCNDGCSLKTETGELTINDVKIEDSGEYTPEINGKILSAQKLQVFSPVPKPRITPDCNPEQTKCTLTCSFDRTDDLGDVEVFWILDDRREKGTELQITKDTKEKTFICSLKNPVSFESSTKLKNPLFSGGRRHHHALILLFIAMIGVGVFWIFYCKIHKMSRGRNEQRSSAGNTREERQNNRSTNIPLTEESTSLLETAECNQTSNVTVRVEINPQTESNGLNPEGSAENPSPAPSSETKPDPEPNTTNMEENSENQNPAPSLDTKPDPESNISNTQEPAENPAPSSDSNPDPDSGSAENDLPEAERPEDSSGSPGGTVSTSEPS